MGCWPARHCLESRSSQGEQRRDGDSRRLWDITSLSAGQGACGHSGFLGVLLLSMWPQAGFLPLWDSGLNHQVLSRGVLRVPTREPNHVWEGRE